MRIVNFISAFFIVAIGQSQPIDIYPNAEKYQYGPANCVIAGAGVFWIGGDKGLVRFDPQLETDKAFSGRTTSRPVLSLYDAGKSIWVGIEGKGLYLFNKKSYQFRGFFKAELGRSSITTIFDIGNNWLGFATIEDKLYRFNRTDTSFGGECTQNKEIAQAYLKATSKVLSENRGVVLPVGELKLFFREDSIWKRNTNRDHVFLEKNSLSIPKSVASSGQYHMLISSDGLILYNEAADRSEFLINKQSLKFAELGIEMQDTLDQVSHDISEVPVSSDSSHGNNWWLVLFTGVTCGLLFFILFRLKYRKDIKILEEEILRLKKTK